MDPSRIPRSPPGLKRRRVSPTAEQLPMLPPGHLPSQQQQTSLPSIRQLHPYLPPSSSSGLSQQDGPGYTYPHFPLQADPGPSHAMTASQRDPSIYGVGESEADDLEQQGPPKKKRRRQALSCTGDYLHSFVIRPVLFYSDLPGLCMHLFFITMLFSIDAAFFIQFRNSFTGYSTVRTHRM